MRTQQSQITVVPAELQPALERLEELAALPANWDSYGASPLSALAVIKAIDLIHEIAGHEDAESHVPVVPWTSAPIADGGVQIEWAGTSARIEVHIGPAGEYGYLFARAIDGKQVFEEQDDVARSALVAQFLLAVNS